MRKLSFIVLLGGALLWLPVEAATEAQAPSAPAAAPAIKNFHRVSDALYRCAQPEDADFASIEKLGVRTVVNLRHEHGDHLPTNSHLREIRIPMTAEEPTLAHVEAFLKVMADTNNLPVLVHCRRGADRTGLMVASYRIVLEDWDKEKAIREMRNGGFGFYPGYRGIVDLLRSLDAGKLRHQLGLPEPAPAAAP
jgi:tyrosine-protein phosphatase SIW14